MLLFNVFISRSAGPSDASHFPPFNLKDFLYTLNSQVHINTTALFMLAPITPLIANLLRKAFPRTAYNVQVLPYFRSKSIRYDKDDVTLITWGTYDRLDRLVGLAASAHGPVSVAFYLPRDDLIAANQLAELVTLYQTNPSLSSRVDIHLVTADRPLLHNTWRNIARTFTSTDWVLLWDIDFEPCTDYQSAFRRFRQATARDAWVKELENGRAALVIPPFEWVDAPGEEFCPKSKQDLRHLYDTLSLDAFETDNPVLSHATDYAQFMNASRDEPYMVTEYEFLYEIYGIFRQDTEVWCDERFAGAGYNRAACTASMYMSGMNLYVLPDQWAIHHPHTDGAFETRSSEDTTLSWKTFLTDICHSYADSLALKGRLHLDSGNRVLSLCRNRQDPALNADLARLVGISETIGA
ncbi:hypothetical protein L486_03876 [Kwoniella mangroviensis CBS 10435]|uniref:Glycosyltransferase family 49 protein n=1 Tax=Kwoniella mangroviensis CBS 10435 TaxID=1331196 RepID=A0A1B9IV03_9TREE|nr:uncharacterized protein I203_08440 [Kwoniella mangroviensis CBS 8507]OCF59372.1 hypothetical protein L486_03876 [Kwoniella mangroviensis CBS 10435]OCF62493.1 hypothetical protein I203_08440 [Kwoniella mangroviensis CBS 8507]